MEGNKIVKKRFLVVSPHPDDAELGLGGTILKWKKAGHEVCVVDLTSGEPTPFGTAEKRKEETKAASEILEIDQRVNLDLPNRYLPDGKENRLLLAEQIRLFRPDALFCPFPEDAHPDHTASARLTEGARFYAKYTGLDLKGEPHYPFQLFYYFCLHLRMMPPFSFLIDISNEFDSKIEAVRCYRSQFIDNPNNRFVFEVLEAQNRHFGSLIRKKYAEPLFTREALQGDALLL